MVWSNWQGAIWRGAIVVVFIWSGLAWTQAPVQRPGDPADRIMVVHENGRKIRCRVEETWQLPDGRVAHLLQALESGEKITIVDDHAAPIDPLNNNPKAMPKRIFAWGVGRKTPPDGSPIPPHLRLDSGVAVKPDAPTPAPTPIANTGKPGAIQILDFQKPANTDLKIAQVSGTQGPGNVQIIQASDPNDKNTPPVIQIGDGLPPVPSPNMANVPPSPFAAPTTNVAQVPPVSSTPNIVPGTPSTPVVNVSQAPATPSANVTQVPAGSCANPPTYIEEVRRPWRPGDRVMDWLQNRNGTTVVTVVDPAPPTASGVAQPSASPNVVTGPVVSDPKIVVDKTSDATEKKSWRPGERIFSWFSGKSQSTAKTETVKSTDPKTGDLAPTLPKSVNALSIPNVEQPAVQEKQPEKIVAAPPGPFSTAMGAQPDVKKIDTVPALPTALANDAKNANLPSAAGPVAEKKDMWGIGSADVGKVPPSAQTRANDPLTMPERFVDKHAAVGPIGGGDLMPGDPSMGGYPLGSQSVIASRSGMLGPVTYIPVPTVTVPQPFNPPLPPEPKMPSPPQLNAYVNAFSPPPQPKGMQEYAPQGMMPAQAMNPAMQQQMAMQQYMMQQQMMQQQAMSPNGYSPAPSQGPAMNFARQYQGPQAPNPVGPGPVMPAAYAPMPQQQPMQPMQPMQPISYQQPSPAASPVDQLIKVLRESPYPAQREWAAQALTSYEWRTNPRILPSLLQSASQDPAASVRAGCVFCLGRMQAAVEPVLSTLNTMRNDTDPRVRQEVQQTLVRLGQAPSGN